MPTRTSRNAGTSSRPDAVDRLRRVLLHERSQQYADRAVIGGLDALLESFTAALPWLKTVPPRGSGTYASMGPGDRQIWIERVLERLASSRQAPEADPGSKTRQRRPSARVANSSSPAKPISKRAATQRRTAPAKPPKAPESLDTPIKDLGIVTRPTVGKLSRAGVTSLRELLWHFPRRHIDYSSPTKIANLEIGAETTVVGHVVRTEKLSIGRSGAAKVLVNDRSGLLSATFFGQPYLADSLKPGTDIALSGKVDAFRGQAQLENPEYEVIGRGSDGLTHAGNLLPVYPSTEGLAQRTLRNATRAAIDMSRPLLADSLPESIRARHAMPGLRQAISDMHYPSTAADAQTAHRRLAFSELLLNQLLVLRNRHAWQSRKSSLQISDGIERTEKFLAGLEFELTEDQQQTLNRILEDMASGVPMARLLQGEVGSGKTIVALSALLAVATSGYKGAFLAPTEVLAEQHFLSTSRQLGAQASPLHPPSVTTTDGHGFSERPLTIGLLTGSQPAAQKSAMHRLIAAGEIDIIIGTHALLQESVDIPDLALAVVDEQHRFGVEQRAALAKRTPRPHMLAMSATPIPRTLALTVYGDLEVSVLKQMPSGRSPLKTIWARDEFAVRDSFDKLRSEINAGRQAFIVCPLIEESESISARAAIPEFERLSAGPLSDLRLGLLHGRMTISDKQKAMADFRDGNTQVLVATPVIEVGVDVPNATVMVILSADRFGLSQLHQLRGRVGRGGNAGTCFLLADDPSEEAIARLQTVEQTPNGFDLADKDLELRGPGEYTGTRQSGWGQMSVATPSDLDLIEVCRDEAGRLLAADPELVSPEHTALAAELELFAEDRPADLS